MNTYMARGHGEMPRHFRRVRRAVRRFLCPLQAAGLLSVHSHIQYDIKNLCVSALNINMRNLNLDDLPLCGIKKKNK